ncbi:MAG: hypothetical protein QOF62_1064 [Pyrinomonadaceae bacterium]|nr:hypothetical protein [Pyrinomonadaceae bacterium]
MNAAAAQSQAAVQSQADTFGRSLFAGQVNDSSISDTQFVTNLYEAFLQRGPDAGGLGWWSPQATLGSGRQNALGAFAGCPAFRDLSGTLYREANWLVSDHLGTPRMIANKSGSLASMKRHDYLPFGEELFADTGGRTTTQGYTGDSVRQKFTQKERDIETGLDYFGARYFTATQGRFTSADPLLSSGRSLQPQSWNRYSYCLNDPLKYVDPKGLIWGTQDFEQDGHKYRRYVWFNGDKVGKGFTAFTPDKDGTVIALKGGGGARIYRNGGSETWPGPGGDGHFNNDGLNFAAGHLRGIANALTSVNPLAQAAVNLALDQVGGVDKDSDLYKKGDTIGSYTTAGALLFVGPGAGAEEGTTTLYRAVSNAEFEQVMRTGTFEGGPMMSLGKHFAETAEDAAQWGLKLEGKGGFKVVDVRIPTVQAEKFQRWERLDGIGPARYAEFKDLTNAVIGKGP